MNFNKKITTDINLLIFISTTTIFILIYLIQKNNYLEYWKKNNALRKELLYYSIQITSKQGSVVGLKRADRIREIATKNLNMFRAEPESLNIIIYE